MKKWLALGLLIVLICVPVAASEELTDGSEATTLQNQLDSVGDNQSTDAYVRNSETWTDKTIYGNVYVYKDATLTLQGTTTIQGNIYIRGSVELYGNTTVGNVYCLSSTFGSSGGYRDGLLNVRGSLSSRSMTVGSQWLSPSYSLPEGFLNDLPMATPTNTPSPIPTATNTPTPIPTATNTPTPIPTATSTPEPDPIDVYNGDVYVVQSETWNARTINGDVYVYQNATLTLDGNTKINGDVYILGTVNANARLEVSGTVNCLNCNYSGIRMSAGSYSYGYLYFNGGGSVGTLNVRDNWLSSMPGAPTSPTPTATPTPSPTATNTPTPVPTATNTPTPIPTATSTPTPIPTATNTPTPVPTVTSTPTPTSTATPTPTTPLIPSVTPTGSPTGTPTPTPTLIPGRIINGNVYVTQSETWEGRTINGNVYVYEGATLTLNGETTINGDILVLGKVYANKPIKVTGTMKCLFCSLDSGAVTSSNGHVYVMSEADIKEIDHSDKWISEMPPVPGTTIMPTPTPTTTPSPSPTATPVPTATATPSPKPTATPLPTPTPEPEEVATVTITGYYNSVKGADIRWTKDPKATGYYIYRKRSEDGTKMVASINDPNRTQFYDSEIQYNCWGRVYVYYVIPFYGADVGKKSNEVTLQRLAPMRFTSYANNTAGKADLTWACTVSDNKALGYEVQYATSKADLFARSGSFKKVSVNGRSNLSKTISGLAKGQTYYFRVRCYVNYTHSVTGKQTKTWSQYSNIVEELIHQ